MSSVFFALGFAFPQIELPSGGDQPSDDPIEPRGGIKLRQAATCGKQKFLKKKFWPQFYSDWHIELFKLIYFFQQTYQVLC